MILTLWLACGPGDPTGSLDTGTPEICAADDAEAAWVRSRGDSDDADAGSCPGASELPYNDVDEDCDDVLLWDVDGDGHADLFVGAPDENADGATDSGAAWLLFGPFGADSTAVLSTDSALQVPGLTGDDGLGNAVTLDCDLDGDGRSDLVFAGSCDDTLASNGGVVYAALASEL